MRLAAGSERAIPAGDHLGHIEFCRSRLKKRAPGAEAQYRRAVPPNIRRFLPLILIALVLLVVLPNLLKKKTSSTTCHPGVSATCANADLAGINLSAGKLMNANFANADLAGSDLHSADLTGANLTGADISDADLANATLTRAHIREANLTGADLTGAINANLRGAIVCHSVLPTARFPVHDC